LPRERILELLVDTASRWEPSLSFSKLYRGKINRLKDAKSTQEWNFRESRIFFPMIQATFHPSIRRMTGNLVHMVQKLAPNGQAWKVGLRWGIAASPLTRDFPSGAICCCHYWENM